MSQRALSGRPNVAASELLVDIGDDTAAWRAGGLVHLWTTDTMVEEVHFIIGRTASWEDVGWKIMAVNLSDIASMGGDPTYALATLGMPSDTSMDDLDMMYKGMTDLASGCGVSIIGGDMVGTEKAFVTIGLLGTCEREPMVRSAAKPGDLIAVTGDLGSSAGGLKLMLGESAADQNAYEFLATAHRRPSPQARRGPSPGRCGSASGNGHQRRADGRPGKALPGQRSGRSHRSSDSSCQYPPQDGLPRRLRWVSPERRRRLPTPLHGA